MSADHSIQVLTGDDLCAVRELRLAMLREAPEAFHADVSEVERWSRDDWRDWMPSSPDACFGIVGRSGLAGLACFTQARGAKLNHKGWMTEVYVAPALRGQGWGRLLVRAVIAHARGQVDVLLTGASAAGAPLYRSEGFETYGVERDASRVNGRSIDDELMAIRFRPGEALRGAGQDL